MTRDADPTKSYRIDYERDGVLIAIANEGNPGLTFGPGSWILVNAHEWARAQEAVALLQAIHERADEIRLPPPVKTPAKTPAKSKVYAAPSRRKP